MNIYSIYLEKADSNDIRQFLGAWSADTMSDALEEAAQYYEIPSHDLVAVQYIPAKQKEAQHEHSEFSRYSIGGGADRKI